MSLPNSKQLNKIREKLEKAEGTLVLAKDASELEKFRWNVCQKFITYKQENKLTQEQIAEIIGTDSAKISKILRHRIDGFTTDRLLSFLQALLPNIKLNIG